MDERIEEYFDHKLDEQKKRSFENEITASPELRDEIAFYLQVKTAARQDDRETELLRKHQLWTTLESPVNKNPWLIRIGVAAVLLLAACLFLFRNVTQTNLQQEAISYVEQSYSSMPVLMGPSKNQLQMAIDFYNKRDYYSSIHSAESYLKSHPLNPEALKVIGFADLQLKKYDLALIAFHKITLQESLYQNPGKFYEGIVYLCRNAGNDGVRAKKLLQDVIDSSQEGKIEALKWLRKSR